MPNIEFYFPSTDLAVLRKLPAVEWGGATQLSLAGLYKSPSLFPVYSQDPSSQLLEVPLSADFQVGISVHF